MSEEDEIAKRVENRLLGRIAVLQLFDARGLMVAETDIADGEDAVFTGFHNNTTICSIRIVHEGKIVHESTQGLPIQITEQTPTVRFGNPKGRLNAFLRGQPEDITLTWDNGSNKIMKL